MKYLPDDHLARVCPKPNQPKTDGMCKDVHHTTGTKPEFSFASLQYMRKYNLLPSGN